MLEARKGRCLMHGNADARWKARQMPDARQGKANTRSKAMQMCNARQGICAMQGRAYAQCKQVRCARHVRAYARCKVGRMRDERPGRWVNQDLADQRVKPGSCLK
jgi:hypothetical protein